MNKSSRRVAVIAAHPDDEILGCGATTARHAADGDEVYTLILGKGIAARASVDPGVAARDRMELEKAARKANRRVGVRELRFEDFPDNAFDSIPLLEIVHAIERFLNDVRPRTVYTHSSADLNVDHQAVAAAVRAATRPIPGCGIKEVYAFEVPSATDWRFDRAAAFMPARYVDVSKTISKKLAALTDYASEMRPFPHSRSIEALEALAKLRGSQAGVRAAECFEVVRQLA